MKKKVKKLKKKIKMTSKNLRAIYDILAYGILESLEMNKHRRDYEKRT